MKLGNFPKAECGRFWILAFTHVDQPKSTEKLNKAILLNLNCSMTGLTFTTCTLNIHIFIKITILLIYISLIQLDRVSHLLIFAIY